MYKQEINIAELTVTTQSKKGGKKHVVEFRSETQLWNWVKADAAWWGARSKECDEYRARAKALEEA